MIYTLAYFAAYGSQHYATVVTRDLFNTLFPEEAAFHAGRSARPADQTFSDELAAMEEERRLLAIGTAISARRDTQCSAPALSAVPVGNPSDTRWDVACMEGVARITFVDNVMQFEEVPQAPKHKGPAGDKTKG